MGSGFYFDSCLVGRCHGNRRPCEWRRGGGIKEGVGLMESRAADPPQRRKLVFTATLTPCEVSAWTCDVMIKPLRVWTWNTLRVWTWNTLDVEMESRKVWLVLLCLLALQSSAAIETGKKYYWDTLSSTTEILFQVLLRYSLKYFWGTLKSTSDVLFKYCRDIIWSTTEVLFK